MPKAEDLTEAALKLLLPKPAAKAVDHWRKLRSADYVVVSFPKCGRTWLIVMLSMLYSRTYELGDEELLGFANLHNRDPRIPKIYFTHDGSYKAAPGELKRDKTPYERHRVVFLVRDPRDVIVSLYFHRAHRDHDLDVSLFDFVMGERGGLATVVEFYNIWWAALRRLPAAMLIKYEDMSGAPVAVLDRIAGFMGMQVDRQVLESVARDASFARMRKLEEKDHFERGCLRPGSAADDQSFKVRRGKVGGWVDYFSTEEIERIDALVARRLNPAFGYAVAAAGATAPAIDDAVSF